MTRREVLRVAAGLAAMSWSSPARRPVVAAVRPAGAEQAARFVDHAGWIIRASDRDALLATDRRRC